MKDPNTSNPSSKQRKFIGNDYSQIIDKTKDFDDIELINRNPKKFVTNDINQITPEVKRDFDDIEIINRNSKKFVSNDLNQITPDVKRDFDDIELNNKNIKKFVTTDPNRIDPNIIRDFDDIELNNKNIKKFVTNDLNQINPNIIRDFDDIELNNKNVKKFVTNDINRINPYIFTYFDDIEVINKNSKTISINLINEDDIINCKYKGLDLNTYDIININNNNIPKITNPQLGLAITSGILIFIIFCLLITLVVLQAHGSTQLSDSSYITTISICIIAIALLFGSLVYSLYKYTYVTTSISLSPITK